METETVELAKATEILSQTQKTVPGMQVQANYQTLEARILNGPDVGKTVTIQNDYLNLSVGQEFYVTHTVDSLDGIDAYNVQEPYRLPDVALLVALFIAVVVIFGGKQGLRGLISLAASLAVIFWVLLPAILNGYSPIWVSIGISSFIIVIGSYVTHGFNRATTAAVVGMIVTICLTGVLALWAVHATQFTGYTSEEASYLSYDLQGKIDFVGLLLGGIMIGLLGILYDAAIGQAVAVEELCAAAGHYTRRQIYQRALRIGREHIGALVNTLAIAYVGASLPLLLLLHFSNIPLAATINEEIFSSEIVRTVVGSIGLVLAVPITTLIAVVMLHGRTPRSSGHSHQH
jgi:uncharacterized membrane protein